MIRLASCSPRRRELLAHLGVAFRPLDVDVDETPRAGEAPDALVRRLAVAKAEAGLALAGAGAEDCVLGADTVVVLGDEVLGKPDDAEHALEMLARLSGRRHRVLSAVALGTPGGTRSRMSESRVTFRSLTPAERAAYVATGEPLDKAGAYGIQGGAAAFVTRLEGSYTGVVGLPLFETAALLREAGVPLFASELEGV